MFLNMLINMSSLISLTGFAKALLSPEGNTHD